MVKEIVGRLVSNSNCFTYENKWNTIFWENRNTRVIIIFFTKHSIKTNEKNKKDRK